MEADGGRQGTPFIRDNNIIYRASARHCGTLPTLALILTYAEPLSAPRVSATGDGGAEHLATAKPHGPDPGYAACSAAHKGYTATQAPNPYCMEDLQMFSLPLLLQPSKTKEARSCRSHKHASMSKPASKTSTVQMCHCVWCGGIWGPHRIHQWSRGNCSSFVPSAFQTCIWPRSWGRRCWSATKSWRTPCSRCTPPTRSKCKKSR